MRGGARKFRIMHTGKIGGKRGTADKVIEHKEADQHQKRADEHILALLAGRFAFLNYFLRHNDYYTPLL